MMVRRMVVLVAAAVLLAGCSASSQRPPVSSRPSGNAGQSGVTSPRPAHKGPVRVLLELDGALTSPQGGGGGAGNLALGTKDSAKRLADALGLQLAFYDQGDPVVNTQHGCAGVAGALAKADVVVTPPLAGPMSGLEKCALEAGLPVVDPAGSVWARSVWAASSGVVAPAAVSAFGWGAAAGNVLKGSATPPKKVALLTDPGLERLRSDAAAMRADLLAGLRSVGVEAVVFALPDATSGDQSSYESALALVPAKLRALGVDALVSEQAPLPTDALVRQKFTPPVVVGVSADLGGADKLAEYPAAAMHQVGTPLDKTALVNSPSRFKELLGRTAAGRQCLKSTEVGGVHGDLEEIGTLLGACIGLQVVAAVRKQPGAVSSPAAFTAALRAVGSLELADGTVADFAKDGRGGASVLAHGVPDAGCQCFRVLPDRIKIPGGRL